MTRIAIIADDLTGALDTASPFACRGLKTEVALDVDNLAAITEGETEVLGVSTNSRHLSASEAGKRAAKAATIIKAWGPSLVLKKIDSRLKGNIAVEIEAVAEVFRLLQVEVAPAVPDVGRLVRGGKVVGAGVGEPLDIANKLGFLRVPVSIRDASHADDLEQLAASWEEMPGTLYVCARGLAVAFAQRFGRGGAGPHLSIEEPVIAAIGSRDPVTDRQVDLLCEAGDFHRISAPDGLVPAAAGPWGRIVYQCTGDARAPTKLVAQHFARGIAGAVASANPRTLLMSGGDTALAILRELGVTRLGICGEAAPGLPWFMIPLGSGPNVAAISKSGGFGDDGVLLRLFSPSPSSRESSPEPKARYGSH
jgi:uncharacterized protein YgbK (DUF1537 family)